MKIKKRLAEAERKLSFIYELLSIDLDETGILEEIPRLTQRVREIEQTQIAMARAIIDALEGDLKRDG